MASTLNAVRLRAEGVRSVAFGDISGTYADVGTPTDHPARIIMVKNTTDTELVVSWDDGVTDVFILPPGGADTLDVFTNGGPGGAYLPSGSQFQVKDNGVAATEGGLILQIFYVE